MSTPAAPVEPNAPEQSSHKTLEAFGVVVTSLGVISGLILTIYTQKPGVVVPWVLFVLGLSVFTPIVLQVPRLVRVGVGVVVGVALISSSIVTYVDPRLLTHTTIRVVREASLTGSTFTTDIKLAPVAEPIPFCNDFLGTGTIPSGYELWIFDRNSEDPTADYYLDSQAIAVGNNWSAANNQIGNGDGDAGNRTTIFAVLLTTHFMQWLALTANTEPGLPSLFLPPGALIADQMVVTQSSDTKPCPS